MSGQYLLKDLIHLKPSGVFSAALFRAGGDYNRPSGIVNAFSQIFCKKAPGTAQPLMNRAFSLTSAPVLRGRMVA
jgi:hypothetical protein